MNPSSPGMQFHRLAKSKDPNFWSVSDESDLEEVYQTERHLLYVACTRARDHLLVTAVAPGSEFLEDMKRNA